MKEVLCPFCQDSNFDVGGACCFCDYEGVVTIGEKGTFKTVEQYNSVFKSNSYKDKIRNLKDGENITQL